ncbi:amino acid permease [Pseudomonas aeruginosa]|jgi:hypothetical protein|nr:amino acid permease [Pseudomonas aeruginosa]MCO3037459.1 amino acid permease [Pseudomonas aeruginosa]PTV68526.1 amino acid permease [Pseudomonas aeruginosa]PTV80815.1 amino acid permease [Pseudomonas aeruginosa]PTV87688.1 amino acid permease [Pseudomonas aeruginosa]
MRVFAFLLAGLALALFLTVYPPKPHVESRTAVRTGHPVASIGEIFRHY